MYHACAMRGPTRSALCTHLYVVVYRVLPYNVFGRESLDKLQDSLGVIALQVLQTPKVLLPHEFLNTGIRSPVERGKKMLIHWRLWKDI